MSLLFRMGYYWHRVLCAVGVRRKLGIPGKSDGEPLYPGDPTSPFAILGRAIIRAREANPDGLPESFCLTPDNISELCAPLPADKFLALPGWPDQAILDASAMWDLLSQAMPLSR